MFSTATVTALLFVVFLLGLGITIWIDRKKTYLSPPNLNFQDGTGEADGEGVLAEHEESTETGDLKAKVSAGGAGSASSCAMAGFEYSFDGEREKIMVAEIRLSYAFSISAVNSASKVKARVEMCMNSKSVTIAEASLPAQEAGVSSLADAVSEKTQKLAASVNPSESMKIYIRVYAEIENAEGDASAEVTANIDEIMYRDEISPM